MRFADTPMCCPAAPGSQCCGAVISTLLLKERVYQLERKAVREALEGTELLKAELLGTVSHELRGPLAAIKGYAATLLRVAYTKVSLSSSLSTPPENEKKFYGKEYIIPYQSVLYKADRLLTKVIGRMTILAGAGQDRWQL